MNIDATFVGLHFGPQDGVSPQTQIEEVVRVTATQTITVVEHDSVSIFEEDGSSYHALRLVDGDSQSPLESFTVDASDVCRSIENESEIEPGLRQLDLRTDLTGPAYLRTQFDIEKQVVRYFVCRAKAE